MKQYSFIQEDIQQPPINNETEEKKKRDKRNKIIKVIIGGVVVTGAIALTILYIRKRINLIKQSKINDTEKSRMLNIEQQKLKDIENKVTQSKKVIKNVSNDMQMLFKLRHDPCTQRYIKYVGGVKNVGTELNTGALKGVQDSSRSWSEFDQWLQKIVINSNGKYRIYRPAIGSEYENTIQTAFNDEKILSLSRARVSGINSIGLIDHKGNVILRALVNITEVR